MLPAILLAETWYYLTYVSCLSIGAEKSDVYVFSSFQVLRLRSQEIPRHEGR